MKIAIIGAGGVRTPLLIQSLIRRQKTLDLREVSLLDIDAEQLERIRIIIRYYTEKEAPAFKLTFTTDSKEALKNSSFIITTFRVGNMPSRVIDEKVALKYNVLGQETTGPGGFAMGMRTIPVLLGYIEQMKTLCPEAWLINFANPSGMVSEAAVQIGKWDRTVGICDAPSTMLKVAAAFLGVPSEEIFFDYFGLNHLGWIRGIYHSAKNVLPSILDMIKTGLTLPEMPFSAGLLSSLGMIPNEYLYYYYYAKKAVLNIQKAEHTRGEQLVLLNQELFSTLKTIMGLNGSLEEIFTCYSAYLSHRGETYMESETSKPLSIQDRELINQIAPEGYSGVALYVIEGLYSGTAKMLILNLPNQGAIKEMNDSDTVEIPAIVGKDWVHALSVGSIPDQCLGLMKQVKAYEKLTIEAAVEGSFEKALHALTIHPLVQDETIARCILIEYIQSHGGLFPKLN